jgi:hypothetical protein
MFLLLSFKLFIISKERKKEKREREREKNNNIIIKCVFLLTDCIILTKTFQGTHTHMKSLYYRT